MPKKGVQVHVIGKQRRTIDVDLMVQAVVALGRELAQREPAKRGQAKLSVTAGAQP